MRKTFLSFMAGALVIGSFMFASDRLQLFTPDAAGQAVAAETAAGAANVQTASLTSAPAATGSISDIAAKASPAVVKIEATDRTGTQGGMGTGFIFESTGYILTNEHVVDGASRITVNVQGYDTPFEATLLGSSYDLDLAVLKITGTAAFPTLPIGDSDALNTGDWVVAIGNPYDFDYSVTAGVISAKERPIRIDDEEGARNYRHLLQTDAAINPGNSGGPLLNLQGEVIGINTAVSTEAQGIGFAIPASTIKSVVEQLKNSETIPSPYIGVNVQDLTPAMLGQLQLGTTDGALISGVQRSSPASQGGLRQYDVVTAVNGTAIKSSEELLNEILASKVGDAMKLTVSRDGQSQDITVTVGDKNDFRN